MPPDSSAPSGTSARIRDPTASTSSVSSVSIASPSVPVKGLASPARATFRNDQ